MQREAIYKAGNHNYVPAHVRQNWYTHLGFEWNVAEAEERDWIGAIGKALDGWKRAVRFLDTRAELGQEMIRAEEEYMDTSGELENVWK